MKTLVSKGGMGVSRGIEFQANNMAGTKALGQGSVWAGFSSSMSASMDGARRAGGKMRRWIQAAPVDPKGLCRS